jgi:hypothetical protein
LYHGPPHASRVSRTLREGRRRRPPAGPD